MREPGKATQTRQPIISIGKEINNWKSMPTQSAVETLASSVIVFASIIDNTITSIGIQSIPVLIC